MRLTTRLLDMASWLLIRRALKEGDISETEAQKKRKGVALQAPARSSHVTGFGELPEGLRTLVGESYALQDRIIQLDRAMSIKSDDVSAGSQPAQTNPVGSQLDRLRVAFAR
jgi:regulator of CtrA degradation